MEAVSPEAEEAGAVTPAENEDEAAGAESGTGAPAAVAEARTAEADGAAEVADEAGGTDGARDADGVDTDGTVAGAVGPEAVEAVEIPKQQSADAAADNEAGEGARR
ncbi:hypothetical protein [Streptomyces sp. NPDC007355]|uniref:hypothetical protein n=1 Tax=Streptomyces sp. NPDC007355 TaxID=3364778 RepID=UPI003694E962